MSKNYNNLINFTVINYKNNTSSNNKKNNNILNDITNNIPNDISGNISNNNIFTNNIIGGANTNNLPLKKGITVYFINNCMYSENLLNLISKNFNKKNIFMSDNNNIIDKTNNVKIINVSKNWSSKKDFFKFIKSADTFDKNYSTFPIVFIKNIFIGGYTDYKAIITKNYKKYKIIS